MDLLYANVVIASVASLKCGGAPGLGMPQLVIQVAIAMQPDTTQPAPRILTIHGHLSIGSTLIAPLQTAEHAHVLECVPTCSQTFHVLLRAFLTPEQVRAIDERRSADGGFVLGVALAAQIDGHHGLLRARQEVKQTVTGADWARILKEMQFEDRATFEVPIEGGRVGPPLDKAAAYMRAALDKLQLRQWEDALTKCREVLTELQQFLPATGTGWENKPKQDWNVQERLAAVHAAIRHITHAGAHASIGTAHEHEVRLTVTLTAALLRYCASR